MDTTAKIIRNWLLLGSANQDWEGIGQIFENTSLLVLLYFFNYVCLQFIPKKNAQPKPKNKPPKQREGNYTAKEKKSHYATLTFFSHADYMSCLTAWTCVLK